MSKSDSGLFQGTLGSTYENSTSKETSYTDRGIEVPKHIQDALAQLKKTGDYIKSDVGGYSMTDASIMSIETGSVSITIDDARKQALLKLFGGK